MAASKSVAFILLSIISVPSVSAPPAAVAWPSKQHQGAFQQQQERQRSQQQQRETEERFKSRKQELDNLHNNIPGSGLFVQPSYASPLFELNSPYYDPNAEQEFFEEILRNNSPDNF